MRASTIRKPYPLAKHMLFWQHIVLISNTQCCRRVLTRRKPMLLLRLSGALLLRYAARQFLALLFQLPPRITRFEPDTVMTLKDIIHHSLILSKENFSALRAG